MPVSYGKISYENDQRGCWEIQARPDVMVRLRRIFPRVQSTYAGSILISDTTDVARDIEWILERWPMSLTDSDYQYLSDRASESRQLETVIQGILNGEQREVDRTPARPPRPYQLEAADVALATGSLLVVHGVGMGKSFTGLLTLRDDGALPALVVTLGGVLPNQWLHQLELAFPDMLGYVLPTGDVEDRLRIMRNKLGRDPDVWVLPYSRLQKWQYHLKGRVRTVLFDEIQELRHAGTEKYAAAMSVAADADYKLGLTATPIYGYGDQTHTICEVLRPGALGERGEFLREWGASRISSNDQYEIEEIGPLSHYMTEIGLMHRRTRAEVGLPDDEAERQIYEIDADSDVIEAAERDVADIARRYLAAGVTGIEKMQYGSEIDLKMRQATGLAKAPHVADLVTLLLESEEKILLFGWHHAVYDIWRERLAPFSPMLYTGNESPAQKHVSMESFLTGTSRVLIMSLRAGAGIDGLQDVCDVAVFGELDWSPAVHTQNIGRVARDYTDGRTKQLSSCLGYFCTTDYGSDPLVEDVLAIKEQQSVGLTDPDRALVTQVSNADRIALLAQRVVDRAGR